MRKIYIQIHIIKIYHVLFLNHIEKITAFLYLNFL